jgi:hypothetical protein
MLMKKLIVLTLISTISAFGATQKKISELDAATTVTTNVYVAGIVGDDATSTNYETMKIPINLLLSGKVDEANGVVTNLNLTGTNRVTARGASEERGLEDQLSDRGMVVKGFGATGDGTTDDWAALQDAINNTSNRVLFLPKGDYMISQPLVIPSGAFKGFEGESMRRTVIRASAAMSNMFTIGDTSAQSSRLIFKNFSLDGNSVATNGFWGVRVDDTVFENITVQETMGNALDIGYGWLNTFRTLWLENNSGNGIKLNRDHLGGGNNGVLIDNCKISNNTGWGVIIDSGSGVVITGSTIERNAAGGIWSLLGAKNLNISENYFEGNAGTGQIFTSPSHTVQADILLNGTDISEAFGFATPNYNVRIVGNSVSRASVTGEFIRAVSSLGLTVSDNYGLHAIPLISTPANSSYAQVQDVTLRANKGSWSMDVSVTDAATEKRAYFSTWDNDRIELRDNFFTDDFKAWTLSSVGGGTLQRGTIFYNGYSTVEITNVVGTSDIWEVTLNVTNHPAISGQPVWFGAWVKNSAADMNTRLRIGSDYHIAEASTEASTDWRWIEFQTVMPTSGTKTFGFQKVGGLATDSVYIANPIIALVGAPRREFYGELRDKYRRIKSDANGVIIGDGKTTGDFEVYNNSTPAVVRLSRDAGSTKGRLQYGRNNSGSWQSVAVIEGNADSAANTDGYFVFQVANNAGTLTDVFTLSTNGAVFVPALFGSGASLTIDASGFNGNLTTGTTNLQQVAQAVDDLVGGGSGAGIAGTVINTGTPVIYNLPHYSDTTGTNVAPTTGVYTDASKTNLYVTGIIYGYSSAVGSYYLGSSANTNLGVRYTAPATVTTNLNIVQAENPYPGIVIRTLSAGTNLTETATNTIAGLNAQLTGATIVGDSTTDTLSNKTIDDNSNTILITDYIPFVFPTSVDGTGCTITTNSYTSFQSGKATYAGSGSTNANYAFFDLGPVPRNLSTSTEWILRDLAIRVAGTDTDEATFTIGFFCPASSAAASPTDYTSLSSYISVASGALTTPAAGDGFYIDNVTLTGWAAGVTEGRRLVIGIARLDSTNDDSIVIGGGQIQIKRTF